VAAVCVPLLLAEDATALTNLGDVHVGLGRHAAAVTFYEQALALFGDLGERYGETCALDGLGEAFARLGWPAAAIVRHPAALALAAEIDEREERARAHAALARLHQAGEDLDLADEHRRSAKDGYTELRSPTEAAAAQDGP
jgi:tetratricopeptide (TPR) repeat protein